MGGILTVTKLVNEWKERFFVSRRTVKLKCIRRSSTIYFMEWNLGQV